VTTVSDFRALSAEQISTLEAQGCTCTDWSAVQVAGGFRPERVRNTHFSGRIRLGDNSGVIDCGAGLTRPCGIYHASLHDCVVEDGVRIANVAGHIARYHIGPNAWLENLGMLETRPGARFGNGVEIAALNEGGGREVVLFNRLDSQVAYLMCVHRYRTELVERLKQFAQAEAQRARSDRGTIGPGARICNVGRLVDVNVGPAAVIDGATLLVDGTVLSSQEAPTTVGADVQAEHFIIAEGSRVDGGALLSHTFVGQGCRVGRQFSSENSLLFANCEGFHGEACSVFAGPYTVTHHKSTLLIAGLFSFYNAGSGTNQSNHLYKLGPVHEGKLERGCKTGSFSYMMWPCRVGPFSVVLGKHTRTFDTALFPFSYLEATPEGRCLLTPGFNLTTVGTVRDGAKWPARDRRQGEPKRDRICFDVFSPFTVGRMMAGCRLMKQVAENTDRSVETVHINGADVKRVLLRTGQKIYRNAVEMYLLDKVVQRVLGAANQGAGSLAQVLAVSDRAVFDEHWVDIGGQMMPRKRLDEICRAVCEERIADLDGLLGALDEAWAAYAEDEWAWVHWAYEQQFGSSLARATADELEAAGLKFKQARDKFLALVAHDAGKEFDAVIRTGFGHDGTQADAQRDFASVRGDMETNSFVRQIEAQRTAVARTVEEFQQAVRRLAG